MESYLPSSIFKNFEYRRKYSHNTRDYITSFVLAAPLFWLLLCFGCLCCRMGQVFDENTFSSHSRLKLFKKKRMFNILKKEREVGSES